MIYLGGKAKLRKHLLPIVLADRGDRTYVEPFAGGMNMLCGVTGPRIANDVHPYLIPLWRALLQGWIPPIDIARAEYCRVRDQQERYPPHYVGWVGFGCSYSGKWFGGFCEFGFNPGRIRNYIDEHRRALLKQVPLLKGVALRNTSYEVLGIPNGSLVYCDPPYANTTGYAQAFNTPAFWGWVRRLSMQGHKVFISGYAAPEDFVCVWQRTQSSMLSGRSKSGRAKQSVEKLFTYNYDA